MLRIPWIKMRIQQVYLRKSISSFRGGSIYFLIYSKCRNITMIYFKSGSTGLMIHFEDIEYQFPFVFHWKTH